MKNPIFKKFSFFKQIFSNTSIFMFQTKKSISSKISTFQLKLLHFQTIFHITLEGRDHAAMRSILASSAIAQIHLRIRTNKAEPNKFPWNGPFGKVDYSNPWKCICRVLWKAGVVTGKYFYERREFSTFFFPKWCFWFFPKWGFFQKWGFSQQEVGNKSAPDAKQEINCARPNSVLVHTLRISWSAFFSESHEFICCLKKIKIVELTQTI